MNLIEDFKINQARIIEENAYVSTDTRNLRYLQRKTDGQRWAFRLTSIRLEPKVLKSIMAFLSAVARDNTTLQVFIPVYCESDATTKTVSDAALLGAKTVSMNTTDVAVGDFLRFQNHPKAYQVTAIGSGNIDISPALVEAVPSGQTVTFDGVRINCKLRGRPQEYRVTANDDSAVVEIDVVEVF